MNALILWVALPGLLGVGLYGLRRWVRAVYWAGVAGALILAWMAWQFPIGEPIALRLWAGMPSLRIEPEMILFGSRFMLGNSTRPALVMLYLSAAFWFGGSEAAGVHRLFTPLGLAIAGLVSAALAAETMPAATLLIALAALVSVPIVSSPGKPARRGAVRFLVYIVGGTCLVLFADASLTTLLTSPEEALRSDLASTVLMLALGFALILAVVPFHTWMPMLGEETNPYAAAFIFFLLPLAVSFLAYDVMARYSVSGLTPAMFTVLRNAGALMVAAGGLGAAFERHLGRTLGYAAIAMMGMTLLAISLNDQLGRATALIGIFFAQMLPYGLALSVWGLALCILRTHAESLDHAGVRAAGRSLPVTAGVLLLASLSIAGLPLLAGFPVHLALWTALAQVSPVAMLVSLLGMGGMAVGSLRSLAVLVSPAVADSEPQAWRISETRLQTALLALGGLALLVAGCFPQIYLPTLANMAIIFAGGAP